MSKPELMFEPFTNKNNDKTIVDTARTSFDKFNSGDDLSLEDKKLIEYLIRNHHISTLFHNNFVFECVTTPDVFIHRMIETQGFQNRFFILEKNLTQVRYLEKGSLLSWALSPVRGSERYIKNHCGYASDILNKKFRDITDMHIVAVDNYSDLFYQESTNELSFTEFYNEFQGRLSMEDYGRLISITHKLKIPIWMARQYFRHNVGFFRNEMSRRYVNTGIEFHTSPLRRKPEKGIKQGSSKETVDFRVFSEGKTMIQYLNHIKEMYEKMDAEGVAPESARQILPQNTMTIFVETTDIFSLARMESLRNIHTHAQQEIKDFCTMVDYTMTESHHEVWEFCKTLYSHGIQEKYLRK